VVQWGKKKAEQQGREERARQRGDSSGPQSSE
jgi:hypothetical protein